MAIAVSGYLPVMSDQRGLQALEDASSADAADLADAAEEAALAHRLNPLAVDPLLTQASIAQRVNNPRSAINLLRQAARIEPDNSIVRRRLFLAYTLAGYLDESADALIDWARSDPLASRFYTAVTASQVFVIRYPSGASPTAAATPPG
jgi:hypothetical protein